MVAHTIYVVLLRCIQSFYWKDKPTAFFPLEWALCQHKKKIAPQKAGKKLRHTKLKP